MLVEIGVFVFVVCSDTQERFFLQVVLPYMDLLCCCRHGDEAHKYHFPSVCVCVCVCTCTLCACVHH